MACRLCLIESDEGIDIFSAENISCCIEKYLQLRVSPKDPVSRIICALCWDELNSFQNFVYRVEEAQKRLSAFQPEVKLEDVEISGNNTPFVELENVGSDERLSTSPIAPLFEVVELKKEEISEIILIAPVEAKEIPITQSTSVDKNNETLQVVESIVPTEEIRPKRSRLRSIKLKEYETDQTDCVKAKRKYVRRPNIEKDNLEKQSDTPTNIIEPQSSRNKKTKLETKDEAKRKAKRRSRSNASQIRKTPSERTKRLLETSKKFDDIIRKHMTLHCDICKMKLTDFAELKIHFRRVHNLKGYAVCCNKRMHKRHLVVDHITSHEATPYTCIVCGKNASSRDGLRSHLKYVHLTKREFECTICDKAFKKAIDLKEHTATHTGEALYVCPHCPKTFTSRATMHGHRKEKHRAEWEANKRCSYF